MKATLGAFDEVWGTIEVANGAVNFEPEIPEFAEILMSVWEDAKEACGKDGEELLTALADYQSGFGTWVEYE
jgi:hypothetical protein